MFKVLRERLDELITQGSAIKECIALAQTACTSKNKRSQKFGWMFFISLFEQNHGINELNEVIKQEIKKKNVMRVVGYFLKKLVNRGLAYDVALTSVESVLVLDSSAKSEDFEDEKSLLETLIKKFQESQNSEEAELLKKATSLMESIAARKKF